MPLSAAAERLFIPDDGGGGNKIAGGHVMTNMPSANRSDRQSERDQRKSFFFFEIIFLL
jgi:hypothetical protein